MNNLFRIVSFILALGIFTGLNSCKKQSLDGMILITRVPVDNFNIQENDLIHKYNGSQLVALDPENPKASEIVLTNDFYSACSPSISYDAKRMIFTGQQNKNDSWQIWEMNLINRKTKKITDFDESCYSPVYLPKDRLVFSKQMPQSTTGPVHALHTMNLNGSNINQITFQPHFDYVSSVLNDGRILMLTKQLYPEAGDLMYLSLRPNGTKAELFYKGGKNNTLNNRSFENKNELVYFIEWDQNNQNSGEIISVNKNRPLFTRKNITSEIDGSFYSVLTTQSGKMIVSYSQADKSQAGLYNFSVQDNILGEPIYLNKEYNIVETAIIEAYKRPRDLPDDTNPEISTGLLLCQDVNLSEYHTGSDLSDNKKATKVELLGIDKSLGIVTVEEDGSFYLKVKADTPIRFQSLDVDDNIINGPSGWMWVRPFERRGCVGCHADPELTPDNYVPFAVKKSPVIIPVEKSQKEVTPAVE